MTANQAYVTLNDGRAMPQLGLGVWQTADDQTASVVRDAIAAGYRAIDTALVYKNEDGVGEALAGRDDIFVTTKLWNSDQGFDTALRAFDASAKRLKRDVVDLYLIHWPAPKQGRFVQSWKALVRLQAEGRIRSIGVSNFAEEHLTRIIDETGVTPAVNQIELHPTFQQKPLRAFHDRHGVKTESWSPLGQGTLLQNETLAAIGRQHGKTAAQVIIRWHLDNGLLVIPKSSNAERLRQNFDVWDFRLDDEEMQRIEALDSAGGRLGPDPFTASF